MTLEKFININWFMERKPYKVHSSYDIFYLNICRELFKIINSEMLNCEEEVELEDEDIRELAYILTAYFEDVTNNYGFWQSLVDLHQKLYNKRLPLFDEKYLKDEGEEYEDVNPADIHYLLFISYCNLMTFGEEKTMVFFYKEFLLRTTDAVWDYFSNIDEIMYSDFYEKFLEPDKDYIDFKLKLEWFTFSSYLTGIEFSNKLEDISWDLIEAKVDKTLFSPALYAETDRLLFEMPSSLSAFFPLDILAGALRCSEQKKQEVSDLKFRAHGIFYIQSETLTHFSFWHTATGEEFDVLKSSFNQLPDLAKDDEFWITTVAKWDDDYYISGMCLPSPYKGEEIYEKNLEMQHQFQKHFPEYRKQLDETALQYRNHAVQFFGSELIVFDTGKALNEKINEFNQWYFDHVTDHSKITANDKPVHFRLPKDLIEAINITLFIPPKDGLEFIFAHPQLLHLLQLPEPEKVSKDDIVKVLPMILSKDANADYWFYLKKNFPLPNLNLFLKCPAEKPEDFEAVLRMYMPNEFSPLKLPRFSTFTSERISKETIKKIFTQKEE